MNASAQSERGLALLMLLNWDRALSCLAIFLSLVVGAWILPV
ncbi:hypothetical protein RSK20926_18342 [Roseobacter sp. SK209-2-6]|nr:hypothetical protein [Roseobacter sp. SK209-2-6]EBA17725.1 hypothetical protein RSK20926_18342 [Roseobacter sp. SK209-2-6]